MTGRGISRSRTGGGAVAAPLDPKPKAAPAERRNEAAEPKPGRKAPRSDASRIAELKAKLGDEAYMAGAILRIATVLSARLTEGYIDGRRSARG
jgi:hypothetical protein